MTGIALYPCSWFKVPQLNVGAESDSHQLNCECNGYSDLRERS